MLKGRPMPARIEIAEFLSFHLRVPKDALERIVVDLRDELPLSLRPEDTELVLEHEGGDSFLRFRTSGEAANLSEACLCNDDQGLFYQRVLGGLMTRYAGDLHVRLVWNDSDRNTHGAFTEVRVRGGKSTDPGMSQVANALRNTLVAASTEMANGQDPFSHEPAEVPFDAEAARKREEEAREVEALLEKGRAAWAEYQRLKAQPHTQAK